MKYSYIKLFQTKGGWQFSVSKDDADLEWQQPVISSAAGYASVWCPQDQETIWKCKLIDFVENEIEEYIIYHNKLMAQLRKFKFDLFQVPFKQNTSQEVDEWIAKANEQIKTTKEQKRLPYKNLSLQELNPIAHI